MKRVLIAAALALALPGTAAAAPFGELPPRGTGDGATCLRPTGVPGELSYSPKQGFPGKVALLHADASGLHAAGAVPAEPYGRCAELAARPSGAAIVAFYAVNGLDESALSVALREPGAPAWGAPADLIAGPNLASGRGFTVAVADSGAAVLAAASKPTESRMLVRAFRRDPGGGFGPAETLFSGSAADTTENATVRSGMSATGEAVVAWSFRPRDGAPREVWASVAPPGGPFHPPARIGALRGSFALGVGDGGHAVLAFPADEALLVAERGPGADFGPATPLGAAGDPYAVNPAVAVRPDGAAVVAWAGGLDGGLQAAARGGPGPFGAATTVMPATPLGFDRSLLGLLAAFEEDDDSADSTNGGGFGEANATIAGERAVVAWTGPSSEAGLPPTAPRVATLPLAGGPAETHTLGNGLSDVESAVAIALSGGSLATVWNDQSAIHLAVEGAADAPDEAPPRVRVHGPRHAYLAAGKDLALPVTCSAACDVRASLGDQVFSGGGSLSLRRAGSGTLVISSELRPIGRLDGGPTRIHLRYGAPRARHATAKTLVVHVRRGRVPPLPAVRRVSARRERGDIVVRWRTDPAARGDLYFVFATATPRSRGLRGMEVDDTGHRFRARLADAPDAKYVTILTVGDYVSLFRRTIVEIQG